MTLAKVKCASRSRSTTHRVPGTDNKYRFRSGMWTSVGNLQDARYFDDDSSYEVDWSAQGKLKAAIARDEDSVIDALNTFSYSAKQKLAKGFGIKANQAEDDLNEALADVAEDLQEEMEAY